MSGGSVGPQETAAILAAVARVLQDEAAAAAVPLTPPAQSPWVLAWRPREYRAPLPSQTLGSEMDAGPGI